MVGFETIRARRFLGELYLEVCERERTLQRVLACRQLP